MTKLAISRDFKDSDGFVLRGNNDYISATRCDFDFYDIWKFLESFRPLPLFARLIYFIWVSADRLKNESAS